MEEKIVIGATLAPFAMGQSHTWSPWLRHMQDHTYFAALELDDRGESVYKDMFEYAPYLHRWTFTYGDGRQIVTTANRGRHIAMGRNMIFDYAFDINADFVLMMDADIELLDDTIPKLLEVGQPVVGAYCPAFNMNGRQTDLPGDTRIHLATGCTLIHSQIFRSMRYTPLDDWGFQDELYQRFGVEQYVRHDAVVKHHPEAIPPLEDRGYDLRLHV